MCFCKTVSGWIPGPGGAFLSHSLWTFVLTHIPATFKDESKAKDKCVKSIKIEIQAEISKSLHERGYWWPANWTKPHTNVGNFNSVHFAPPLFPLVIRLRLKNVHTKLQLWCFYWFSSSSSRWPLSSALFVIVSDHFKLRLSALCKYRSITWFNSNRRTAL